MTRRDYVITLTYDLNHKAMQNNVDKWTGYRYLHCALQAVMTILS